MVAFPVLGAAVVVLRLCVVGLLTAERGCTPTPLPVPYSMHPPTGLVLSNYMHRYLVWVGVVVVVCVGGLCSWVVVLVGWVGGCWCTRVCECCGRCAWWVGLVEFRVGGWALVGRRRTVSCVSARTPLGSLPHTGLLSALVSPITRVSVTVCAMPLWLRACWAVPSASGEAPSGASPLSPCAPAHFVGSSSVLRSYCRVRCPWP